MSTDKRRFYDKPAIWLVKVMGFGSKDITNSCELYFCALFSAFMLLGGVVLFVTMELMITQVISMGLVGYSIHFAPLLNVAPDRVQGSLALIASVYIHWFVFCLFSPKARDSTEALFSKIAGPAVAITKPWTQRFSQISTAFKQKICRTIKLD
jgi:hypothetical protein